MLTRWLIPGKPVDALCFFSTDIEEFTVSEVCLALESVQDLTMAKRNLTFLEGEILMGVKSSFHAGKILEMKGLSLDEKTAIIQENIAHLIRRFPKEFDYDLFGEMQHFLITTKETFKAMRQPPDLYRLIYTLYAFRKILEKRVAKRPSKRHLRLKMKKTHLHTPFGQKEVLSLFVGMNFLKEHELFEERHFISALSHFIPGIKSIQSSYYAHGGESEEIHTFYLEIEKEDGAPFSPEELTLLERGLPKEIGSRIEQLVPPIFMPRNEEEVMRNILTLSSQLGSIKDLPQMVISFDEQTDTELSFTVVLVRILLSESLPIRELFDNSDLAQNLSIDRIKSVGQIQRKYAKEATVLRFHLPTEAFLRADYSVDLYKARLHLVNEIESAVGDVRDYNGGMIAKQSENFHLLKQELGSLALTHSLLLQNFFHSIFPVHLSTTLDPKLLHILFAMLLEAIENPKETVALKSKKANDHLFVMTKFQDFSWKQKIFSKIETLKLPSNELLTIQMQIFDAVYLGFLYLNPNKEKQMALLETIPEALACTI